MIENLIRKSTRVILGDFIHNFRHFLKQIPCSHSYKDSPCTRRWNFKQHSIYFNDKTVKNISNAFDVRMWEEWSDETPKS